jgi:hypothetical protein
MAVTLISSIIMALTEETAAVIEAIEDRLGPILILVSGDTICQEVQQLIDNSNSTSQCKCTASLLGILSLTPNSSRWRHDAC